MKKNYLKLPLIAFAVLLFAPAAILAQKEKEKTEKKPANGETIVITKRGDEKEKLTVVIDGDKITVNGKPIEELKDGDITVNRHSFKTRTSHGDWDYSYNNNGYSFNMNENTAMLGVVTETAENGVKITDVTEGSGAEKAGLKEDDIITKIGDKKIENPDELTEVIHSHKPGDKIVITFLRDKKEQKTTAELGKWKGANAFNLRMPDMDFEMMPKIEALPRTRVITGQGTSPYFSFLDNRPKLGLSVQDTEDGKGVKVIDVDEEGNAQKAGVKKDDIILSVNDKEVNSADEVARIIRESREKNSVMLKINRGGKTQNIEVKIPRKLKTADL